MTISTRKAQKLRLGIKMARDRRNLSEYIHIPGGTLARAYDREWDTLLAMQAYIPQADLEEYQGLAMSGLFGFANEATHSRILEIEGAARRKATAELRAEGMR